MYIHLCPMGVYKVIFESGRVVSAARADHLEHGDIGLSDDHKTVNWFAVECESADMAKENAAAVIDKIWRANQPE